MTAHSAARFSSRITGVAAPALAAAVAASPGRSVAGNGDDLTTSARNCPATANDAGGVTGKAPGISGAYIYIYGYDSAGNPTFKDAGFYGISDGNLPD